MSLLQARTKMESNFAAAALLLVSVAGLALPGEARAADGDDSGHPAVDALGEVRGGRPQMPLIQNRFFLKENRFEIAPSFGYVPNNAFVSVPLGGMYLAYHFSESLSAEGAFYYAPNTRDGGIKNLTHTLVGIAYEGNQNEDFWQPMNRPQIGAVFDARYSPVYGKINLVGEGVLNFDVYGTAGLGVLTVANDRASVNPDWISDPDNNKPATSMASPPSTANFCGELGIGMDFFLSSALALKLDARSLLYVADEPDYGNIDPNTGEPEVLDKRLYNTFVTSVGVSIFVPKMKPRLYNF